MIGGALVRFHPDQPQTGPGLVGQVWKSVKARGPDIVKDVLKETALEGWKGLKASDKGSKLNWKGGLAGAKRGAVCSVKRKATQELQRALTKRVRKDLFGV